MPGIGIGATTARYRKRSGTVSPAVITAAIVPATSTLVVGQALNDTANWSNFLQFSNYATSGPEQMISSVAINYIGDTGSETDPFGDGDVSNFTVTVTDTAGNVRTFTVIPRVVVHAPPAAAGALADRSLTLGTGVQSYDASGDFTGADLTFSVAAVPGVSIDGASGVLSVDTDFMTVQSGTKITVTASNSGGDAQSSFDLEIVPARVYLADITGLTDNATHGLTAQIDVMLTGVVSSLAGDETVLHRWTLDESEISGANSATYVPVSGDDLGILRYSPTVDGSLVDSVAFTVRHAPPIAGSLTAVNETQGSGMPTVNLAAGFTGQNLAYTSDQAWATVSGSTLTISDEVLTATVSTSATNSGGSATVDLSVTIAAPVVSVVSPIADQSFARNGGNRTFDLRTVFEKATGYSVAGAGASIDGDGYTLRLDDGALRSNVTITVTGSNAYNSAQDVFLLNVAAVVETDFVMTFQTTVPNETFALGLRNAGTTNATMTIDGGPDIAITVFNDPDLAQVIPTAGIHTLRLSGTAGGILMAAPHKTKVRTVENLGTLGWRTMLLAFEGCTGMTSFIAGNTDTSLVGSMYAMFGGCSSMVTCDVSTFDTSNVDNLQNTWAGCTALANIDVSSFDTSKVIRMDEMLHLCPNIPPQDISGFNLEGIVTQAGGTGGMFNFLTGSTPPTQAVLDAFYIALDAQTLDTGFFFGMGGVSAVYTTGGAAEAARTSLINKGLFFDDAGTTVPNAPSAPSLAIDGTTQITATIAAAPFNNGLPITSNDIRYSDDEATWTVLDNITSPRAITGLDADTAYFIQSRANNFKGDGAWSASATATTTGASVDFSVENSGEEPVITYDTGGVFSFTFDGTTYTTDYEGTTLNTSLFGGSAPYTPICFEQSAITQSGLAEGDTLTGVPAQFLFIGDDPGDATYDWLEDGVSTGNGTTSHTVPAASSGVDIVFRTVYAGETVDSDPVTLGVAATVTVPDAFVDANWSVATGSSSNELNITIATLPGNGGSAITDIEYDVGASGTWVSLATATTGTVTVTMAAPATSYVIRLRAVNSVGNALAGNSKSATSGAAGFDPNALADTWAWYDFTDPSNMFTDTAWTTPVSANGQNVRSINNKAGGGINLTTANPGNTWDAANGQVVLSGAALSRYIGPVVPASATATMEVYAAIKTVDSKFMLICSNNSGHFVAVAESGRGLLPHNGLMANFPTYWRNTTQLTPIITRDTLHTHWSTGAGITASVRGVNMAYLNASGFNFFLFDFSGGAHELTGTVKHVVITKALSAPDRTDLLNWLATEVAV